MNKYSFIGKMATRKILLMQLGIVTILILILLLAAYRSKTGQNRQRKKTQKFIAGGDARD